MENQFFIDSDTLSPAALEKQAQLENDPSFRTDHMAYCTGMEQIHPDIREKVMAEVEGL